MRLGEEAEQELRGRRLSAEQEERRLNERESALDRKVEIVEQRDRELGRRASDFGRREKQVQQREDELEKLIADERIPLLGERVTQHCERVSFKRRRVVIELGPACEGSKGNFTPTDLAKADDRYVDVIVSRRLGRREEAREVSGDRQEFIADRNG